MKSGLKHIDVGAELTKTEWESEDSHELIHGNSFPGSPVERQLFYRDDEHKWYIYNGTSWVWLGGGSGGGGTKIQDADADTKVDTEESADEDKIHMDVKGIKAFLLHDDGILTLAKQSACRAYLSGGDQSIPSATWTKVTLNAESFDIQGEFDPTTNNRFTAKKAGIYLVSALLNLLSPVDQQWIIADVRKNGSSTGQAVMPASGIKAVAVSLSNILSLAANDYLELWAYQDAGSAKNVNTGEMNTFMAVYKLA